MTCVHSPHELHGSPLSFLHFRAGRRRAHGMSRGGFSNHGRGRGGGGGRGGGWNNNKGGGGRGGRQQHDTPLNQLPPEAFFRPVMLGNPWEHLENARGLPHVFEPIPRVAQPQQPQQQHQYQQQQQQQVALQPPPNVRPSNALEDAIARMVWAFGLEDDEMLDARRHTAEERVAWCCDRAATMYRAALGQFSVSTL
jgi:hypothetical protein